MEPSPAIKLCRRDPGRCCEHCLGTGNWNLLYPEAPLPFLGCYCSLLLASACGSQKWPQGGTEDGSVAKATAAQTVYPASTLGLVKVKSWAHKCSELDRNLEIIQSRHSYLGKLAMGRAFHPGGSGNITTSSLWVAQRASQSWGVHSVISRNEKHSSFRCFKSSFI